MSAPSTRHHDLVVIGTGSGNSILGPEFDDLDIGLVERGTFGGTCLNVGCIPTKMFVLPADRIIEAREASALGVTITDARADWGAIRDRVFGRIDPIAAAGEKYRQQNPNVTVYRADARFVGPMTLDTGTGVTVTADRWVIAAGGRPRLLDVPGLGRVDPARGVHTSDTVMRMETLPRRIAIVGGGFIAAEFAHVLDAYGSQVTWLHRGSTLLRTHDGSVRSAFTRIANGRFDVHLGTTVTSATRSDGAWDLRLDHGAEHSHLRVDAVLLAIGRVANTDQLDCERAGLAMHDDGRLLVDEFQRTSAEGVYALGDISSDHALKHVANHEMRVVKHNLTHPDDLTASDHRLVPHAVFSHPQIAAFGPTEQDLLDAGRPYRCYEQRYGDTAYGWALEDRTGFLKVYLDPESHAILAAHCLGPQASTLIQPLIQGASLGQSAGQVAKGQYWIHPALAEVVENALLGAMA
ncbi:MAG: mycothione reductase [Nostocoides sp.]